MTKITSPLPILCMDKCRQQGIGGNMATIYGEAGVRWALLLAGLLQSTTILSVLLSDTRNSRPTGPTMSSSWPPPLWQCRCLWRRAGNWLRKNIWILIPPKIADVFNANPFRAAVCRTNKPLYQHDRANNPRHRTETFFPDGKVWESSTRAEPAVGPTSSAVTRSCLQGHAPKLIPNTAPQGNSAFPPPPKKELQKARAGFY